MENKRKISILIPYYFDDQGSISVFLQRRSKEAKVLPDYFGFFGGGAEGNETPNEALKREIKEELNIDPKEHKHFKEYVFEKSIKNVYFLNVNKDFENNITVLEGQYGKWFTIEEAINEEKLIEDDKLVLREFFDFVKKQ